MKRADESLTAALNGPARAIEILHGAGEPGKSRSCKKRESADLQRLGEELAALPPARLAAFALPPELASDLRLLAALTQHGARRRQLRFIGRRIREMEEEERQRLLLLVRGRDALRQRAARP